MEHNPQFLKVVDASRKNIKETTPQEVHQKIKNGEKILLVDVREDDEWRQKRIPDAIHIGKGVIERDIEQIFPDAKTSMILYCGGGYRSALAAESLGKMGYKNVLSMDGGLRGWINAGYPVDKSPKE